MTGAAGNIAAGMRTTANPRRKSARKPNQKASCVRKKNVVSQTNPASGLKTVLNAKAKAVETAIASAQAIEATHSSCGGLLANLLEARSNRAGGKRDTVRRWSYEELGILRNDANPQYVC